VRRLMSPILASHYRTSGRFCSKSTSSEPGFVGDDKPLKFTETGAHVNYKAAHNWRDPDFEEHTPPSQRNVVIISVSTFLIYFCILREENDVDENLYKPLFELIPDKEASIIEAAILEHKRCGKSTDDLEKRLAELRHQETIRNIMKQK